MSSVDQPRYCNPGCPLCVDPAVKIARNAETRTTLLETPEGRDRLRGLGRHPLTLAEHDELMSAPW